MLAKSDVVAYAQQHPDTTLLLSNGKLRFTQTGMEFPPHADSKTLETYATGRAYRRGVIKRMNEGYDFEQHLPYIVPHKYRNEKHFLFCTLTEKTLPRQKDVIINHTNGKRFKRRYEEAERDRLEKKERQANQNKKAQALKKNTPQLSGGTGSDEGEGDLIESRNVQGVLEGLLSSEDEKEPEDIQMEDLSDAGSPMADALEEEKNEKTNKHQLKRAPKVRAGNYESDGQMFERFDSREPEAKGSPNGIQRTSSGMGTGGSGCGTPSSIKAREFASKKRRRPKTPIPKRLRQTRQKRKSEEMGTSAENG